MAAVPPSGPVDPHAEYDRWMRGDVWYLRVFEALRRVGRWTMLAVYGLLTVGLLGLAVARVLDLREPIIWGTFVAHGCEPSRRGCLPWGSWVSDDGTVRFARISLDGWTDATGTARASYQPTGFFGGLDIVHVPVFSGGVGTVVILGIIAGLLCMMWWFLVPHLPGVRLPRRRVRIARNPPSMPDGSTPATRRDLRVAGRRR